MYELRLIEMWMNLKKSLHLEEASAKLKLFKQQIQSEVRQMGTQDHLFDSYDRAEIEDWDFDYDGDDLVWDDGPDYSSTFLLRVQGVADGAQTLGDAADMLRDYASFLEQMHEDGWILNSPVQNGAGVAYKADPEEE